MTVRPVVRQTFRLEELLDMILSVAGKDVARVRQLLHSGTIVYHFFRYSWTGFDVDDAELAAALAQFPDPDPARPFSPAQCTLAILESGGVSPKAPDGTRSRSGIEAPDISQTKFLGSAFWKSPATKTFSTTDIPMAAEPISIASIWTAKLPGRLPRPWSGWRRAGCTSCLARCPRPRAFSLSARAARNPANRPRALSQLDIGCGSAAQIYL